MYFLVLFIVHSILKIYYCEINMKILINTFNCFNKKCILLFCRSLTIICNSLSTKYINFYYFLSAFYMILIKNFIQLHQYIEIICLGVSYFYIFTLLLLAFSYIFKWFNEFLEINNINFILIHIYLIYLHLHFLKNWIKGLFYQLF